jgi:hypothetical protein
MLRSLQLTNFRRFAEHRLTFRPNTLLVGANNAGKSTIVEALRLVSIITSRYRVLAFRAPPSWLGEDRAAPGVAPSLAGTGIDLSAVMNQYSDPPARICATFVGGQSIEIYLGPDAELHAVLRGPGGALVSSRQQAHNTDIPSIATQPQVAPVARLETMLTPETVRRNLTSTLASSHFRNQLYLLHHEYFRSFCHVAEETWPGFAITDLLRDGDSTTPDPRLRLLVRDGAFVGEIALMGHGLQMWLQSLWFLVRNGEADTVILDEPDVYMHPDLQHRLVRFLKRRSSQLIIATHSTEIMSEVDAADILVVNSRGVESRFANTPEGVQMAIDRMGGVQNVQLARLSAAERCLLVEGEDIEFFKAFQDVLFPTSLEPIDTVPRMSIGGWSGWPYAIGSSMFLRNAAGQQIRVYCILDSDFHTPELIAERKEDAVRAQVDLHIWDRKEIENYLLVASLIHRVIDERLAARTEGPTQDEVTAMMDDIASGYEHDVTDRFAHEYHIRDRAAGLATANRRARNHVGPLWATVEGRIARAPGKAVLSKLSEWSQTEFGVSFGARTLLAEIRAAEIDTEVARIVTAIEHHAPLH